MKKILFISHEASRTGAPIVLLQLLKWLQKNKPEIRCDTLLLLDGPLEQEFITYNYLVYNFPKIDIKHKFFARIYHKVLKSLGIGVLGTKELFLKKLASHKYDLIYANTVISLPMALKIKKLNTGSKLLLHLHELNTIIKEALPSFKDYLNNIDRYIAVSNLVKINLMNTWKIDAKLIDVVYEFSKIPKDIEPMQKSDVFTVGASGVAHWRKGDDIFIQVASYIKRTYPDVRIKFVWVGDYTQNKNIIESDLQKCGLDNIVSFIGQQHKPITYFKDFSVFLMTSREDPFPLVCIEVGMLGKPIICFENATGTAEVLKDGGGYIVPYLDVVSMGEKVIHYYFIKEKLKEDSKKAKQLFSKFTSENMCPLINDIIQLTLH